MNKFYESVPVSTKEIHANPTNLTFIEDDQRYVLRPLPVPEGLPSSEQIGEFIENNWGSVDGGYEHSQEFETAQFVLSIATPLIAKERAALIATENAHARCGQSLIVARQTIASQQAEIERLTNQSNEQQKTLYDNYKLLKRFYDHLDTFGSVFPGNSKEAEAISQQELFSAYKQHRINNKPTPQP